MKWLIWKEYRLNRLILIVGAVLLLGPHLLALWPTLRAPEPRDGISRVPAYFFQSCVMSVVASQLTLCLLGGNLIACERADRSTEFMAYLPVSRARMLAAKLTLALVTAAVIWGPNLVILAWTGHQAELMLMSARNPGFHEFLGIVVCSAIIGSLLFSVGWLLSSFLESPAFVVILALVSPYLLFMVVAGSAWLMFGLPLEEPVQAWFWGICLALAPVCFVTGTWYYLRRVEP